MTDLTPAERLTEHAGPPGAKPTLRDLIRAARANGTPLRRQRTRNDDIAMWWQVWDEPAHRRWVEVTHWPGSTGNETSWRVRVLGGRLNTGYIHVELREPTFEQINGALKLAGWEIPHA